MDIQLGAPGTRSQAAPLLRDLCPQPPGPGRGEGGVLVHRIRPEICWLCRVNSSIEHKGKQSSEKGNDLWLATQPVRIKAQVSLNPGWSWDLKSPRLRSKGTQSQPCCVARAEAS